MDERAKLIGDLEHHIASLSLAEKQYKFCFALRTNTPAKDLNLSYPEIFVYGKHRVEERDLELTDDEVNAAISILKKTSTYFMTVTVRETYSSIKNGYKIIDQKPNKKLEDAFNLARLICNAFVHKPFSPIWAYEERFEDNVLDVPNMAKLDYTNLPGKPLDWHHYGGPLALLKLSQYFKSELKDLIKLINDK